MNNLEYAEAIKLDDKSEQEKAKYLCFFHFKETGETEFPMTLIIKLFENFGKRPPNSSRLKSNLLKGKNRIFLEIKKSSNLEFTPMALQSLEKEIGSLWNDNQTINSNSEFIEEVKFCGKEKFLDKLIKQINFTYGNNCYDACAVLMRRLFEILLILSYQANGIDDEIKNKNGDYLMLEGIVKNARGNSKLKISSRISSHFDDIRNAGNYSAHGITYIAGQKDIDDIKNSYRLMLDELYSKAKLS